MQSGVLWRGKVEGKNLYFYLHFNKIVCFLFLMNPPPLGCSKKAVLSPLWLASRYWPKIANAAWSVDKKIYFFSIGSDVVHSLSQKIQ